MISGWIALKHKTNPFGEWSISPKDYFEQYGRIPDGHANLHLEKEGLDEVMDHTLQARDSSDGRSLLIQAGFEILENPVWYFDPKFSLREENL